MQEFSSKAACSSYLWLLSVWRNRRTHLRLPSTPPRSFQFKPRIHRRSSNSNNNHSRSSNNNKDRQLPTVPFRTMPAICHSRLVAIFNRQQLCTFTTNNNSSRNNSSSNNSNNNQCPFKWLPVLRSSRRALRRASRHQLQPSSRLSLRLLSLPLSLLLLRPCSSNSTLFLFSSICL